MKHQAIGQFAAAATVAAEAARPMSKHERLERWARLLEREPDRRLATLRETEYRSPDARAVMRSADSPITVALADPLFRVEGLTDDTYGAARRFFQVSDRQLHDILCYCRFGTTVNAGVCAQAIRRVVDEESRPSLFQRIRALFARPATA